MKMHWMIVCALIFLGSLANGDQSKYQQAEIRAQLAKAKSITEALIILKSSSKGGSMAMISPDSLKKEQQTILRVAQGLNTGAQSTIEPRNGGCEPRIVCEEVPIDREGTNDIVSFPQCLEVYRCGGCCQEAQFPCVPVREVPVTFSPLLLISLDDTDRYEVNRPLTLMNHTQCECKCGKTEAQCHREGKTLDATLCQCIQPRCSPECLISATCSIVHGSNIPRCTCRRRLQKQTSNFCPNPTERPNSMCTRCETTYG